ncbi:MAG: RNA polymerase sigma factor SigF [Leptolyngbyaceae cyanobacterium SL_1_1]|nr:RNA polymerase sigma factor SigF [Leptolyngbyaceae cyanobacterium RM1_1_2]NJO09406.1 RNA polymerase sigma factor SigF [Leptolyngbyaceae cyanobacterium SL_1_1]
MKSQSSLHTKLMELLVAYCQNPSTFLRNRIVRLNAGLVRKIAHRVSRQCSEPYEDLEQIGYLGLIRAIERFDPTQGCAFSSFAVPYIRGEMLHYLRDRSMTVKIPRRWQELQKAGQKARTVLVEQLGRQPQDDEIAAQLNISSSEWQQVKLSTRNRSPLSLDATVNRHEDTVLTLGDLLPDAQAQVFQVWEEDREQLQQALNQLEEKTRVAIECVYLKNWSRKEVANQIGVSPMTITRRIQRGLEELSVVLKHRTLSPEA